MQIIGVNLELMQKKVSPFLDTEISITPQEIQMHLKEYYANIL